MERLLDSTSRSAIEDILRRMQQAWSAGDGNAYAANFCEDAQYVEAPGVRVCGRSAIAESHQRIFNSVFRNTRVAGSGMPVIRAITADVALVESSGSVIFPGEDADNIPANGLMTLVVRRDGDRWQIVSFQNTPTGRFRMLRMMMRIVRARMFRGHSTNMHRTRNS